MKMSSLVLSQQLYCLILERLAIVGAEVSQVMRAVGCGEIPVSTRKKLIAVEN